MFTDSLKETILNLIRAIVRSVYVTGVVLCIPAWITTIVAALLGDYSVAIATGTYWVGYLILIFLVGLLST